jgi:hypothetical protein
MYYEHFWKTQEGKNYFEVLEACSISIASLSLGSTNAMAKQLLRLLKTLKMFYVGFKSCQQHISQRSCVVTDNTAGQF